MGQVDPQLINNMRLEEAVRKANWTSVKDKGRAEMLCKALGNRNVTAVSQADLDAFHTAMGHSGATRNRWRPLLKKMGIEAKRHREDPTRPRVLTSQELFETDERAREHPDELSRCLYAILRDTGCRGRSELERVRVGDIDFDRRVIRFTSFKGHKKTREVPMTAVALQAVSWWYHANYRLPNDSRWRAFWDSVGPRDSTPYSLRHTFCTRLLDRGVPVPVVQGIMGHSSMEMTMRYYHIRESAIEAARQALE